MSEPLCAHCHEPILPGDARATMANADTDYHHECMFRMMFGSAGHHLKKCSCFGGNEEDPPGLSLREAARAAVASHKQMQHPDEQSFAA